MTQDHEVNRNMASAAVAKAVSKASCEERLIHQRKSQTRATGWDQSWAREAASLGGECHPPAHPREAWHRGAGPPTTRAPHLPQPSPGLAGEEKLSKCRARQCKGSGVQGRGSGHRGFAGRVGAMDTRWRSPWNCEQNDICKGGKEGSGLALGWVDDGPSADTEEMDSASFPGSLFFPWGGANGTTSPGGGARF